MTMRPSRAELLDHAVGNLLAGRPAPGRDDDAETRSLLSIAAAVHRGLTPQVPGAAFEARLARRLTDGGIGGRAWRVLRRHGVVITGAALSSAVLGLGLTAFAVWRGRNRHSLATRLVSR